MDSQEDPYEVLGVPRTATAVEIKKAYRKKALQWHPDKQKNEADKQQANVMFAKISNAYEILGDEQRRREHDDAQASGRRRQGDAAFSSASEGFGQPAGASFHQRQQHGFHHNFNFHDPFEIFAQVFRDEFARSNAFNQQPHQQRHQQQQHQQQQRQQFGASPFGGGLFDDPFFGGGGGMGGFGGMGMFGAMGGGLFGGGQGMDPFASHMMMHQTTMNGMMNGGGMAMPGFASTSSTTTSSMSFGSSGGNNPVVSRTSSTRIVNGQRTTEVTLRRADGTVERHVESTNPPSTNVQRLAHSAPQQAQRRQQQRMQQQQQQQQQRPSTRSGRRKNDGAAAAVGIHGEEQENEDDDAATDFDVCLGNNDHPGTIALIQAVDRALQKYPDDADDANRYRYVRDKMMGRRYFLTLPDNTFLLTADQIQDMIIQILHDRTNRIPRQSSSGSRRDTGGSVPTTSEARRPNANDMNVKPRGVARGSSIDKMQEKYKPPSKRQK